MLIQIVFGSNIKDHYKFHINSLMVSLNEGMVEIFVVKFGVVVARSIDLEPLALGGRERTAIDKLSDIFYCFLAANSSITITELHGLNGFAHF